MNCDPNALSLAASPLCSLSDGMLIAARTSLLCSWAGVATVGTPVVGQWTFSNSGSFVGTAQIVGGVCPMGANGFDFRSDANNPPSTFISNQSCASSAVVNAPTGGVLFAQIRWTLGGHPVSDWSDVKSVNFGVRNGLLNGLLAYWKLDEAGTPATYADATGNGWIGTNNGSIAQVAGKINNGAQINSNSKGITVNGAIDTRASNTPFFVSLWFFNNGASSPGQAIGGEWNTRDDYILFTADGTQAVTFEANDDSGTSTSVVSPPIVTPAWSHIVFGFDGLNIYLYINAGAPFTAAKTAVRRGGGSFVLGNYQTITFNWPGIFDEVAYYNRTLSATDVANLYNSGNALAFGNFTI
jgi:hypothetical protein